MVRKVTLRQMGGSVGATLPKDIDDRLRVEAGDEVFMIETDSGVLLTPYDPAFDKAVAAFQRGARKYRNALRELAKQTCETVRTKFRLGPRRKKEVSRHDLVAVQAGSARRDVSGRPGSSGCAKRVWLCGRLRARRCSR